MKLINHQKGNHFFLIDLMFSLILLVVMFYFAIR